MGNHVVRVLLFVLAVPAILSMVIFDPSEFNLIINSLVLIVALGTAIETAALLGVTRKSPFRYFLSLAAGILPPIAAFIFVLTGHESNLLALLLFPLIALLGIILMFSYPSREQNFYEWVAPMILVIYPGAFLAHFILLAQLDQHRVVTLLFLLTVFLNDSLAYLAGMLFGKGSSHPFPLSPKKTMVGLVVGLCFSVIVTSVGYLVFPSLFGRAGLAGALAIGLFTGFAVVAGDLLESGFKRQAGVKDSGAIIPGRGGLMDSVDSAIFAAPVFYLGMFLVQL